ncbi:uncharacterized protein CDV56_105334 [Aspergillus thermomutatus]|uniref:Uncharacterized protein n=1 Tax=Aspergillus thermomutatus TaxID=41047 RepID=A0A397GNK2_ASPTH|nr:uncharacterized protein CDV56_105334 [Aspergillus thermomutatus]RHZ52621.1 hypothetical protein CDV56_105334 [Aspergillus thermomutatus]
MDFFDQLTDFESLLEQVRHVKNNRNASIQDKAEYFHKTLVDQIGSFSEIEKKHLYRYLKLSRANEELQVSYNELNELLSQELRKVERKNAELQETKAALREAEKDCEAKEEYIHDIEEANAELMEKNQEQRSLIKSYKQDWKAMKDELELRDRTIDDLQRSLRSKGALVHKHEREIEDYRKQRKEWERQVDEAAQYLDDKSEVLKWLNGVGRPLKGNSRASSSEASSSGTHKVSDSVIDPTTDGGADRKTNCTTDSEKEGTVTSTTGSSGDQQPDLQGSAMDCSSEVISVDETKPMCGTTLDEEMMYLSESQSALSIEWQASPMEWSMIDCRKLPSPTSSYDLDLPQRRKRRKQRTKEVEDIEVARKRSKVNPHCVSPVQTDSEADASFDFRASDQKSPETPCPIDCMKTAETIFTVSRGVQTVADQMDGPITIPSIESPEAPGRSQPLLLNGRRGRYKDPVYLPKSYAKSQQLTHQARELDVRRPRFVSVTRHVLRSRVASWPLNQAGQENFGQGDLQQESIATPLVSPSLDLGSESLKAEADAGPVLQTVPHNPHQSSGYRSHSDGEVADMAKKQGFFGSTPMVMGGKRRLLFVTVLVLLLSIVPRVFPNGERRSWDRVNLMPQDPLAKLRECPDSRSNVVRAAEWEIVRRTDSDFLSFV